MRRVLMGLAFLSLAVLPACAADRPQPTSSESDESFPELKKQYDEAMSSFRAEQATAMKAMREAKTDEERKEIQKKVAERMKDNPAQKYSERFLTFAEKHPDDPNSLDALTMVLQGTSGPQEKRDVHSRAVAAVEKQWLKSPKIKGVLRVLANPVSNITNDASEEVVRKVVKENPDRKIQAAACKALADEYKQIEQIGDQIKDNKELKAAYEQQLGKKFIEKLLAKAEKAKDETKKWNNLLSEKYGDTILNLSVGKRAPEVVSQNVEGKEVKLSELRGKVVVLDIWATWCPPCRAMIPHERQMVSRLKEKPFALISISADEDRETLTKFLKETKMPWTHWWNGPKGGIIEDWSVEYFPTIYVLDAKGVIRYKDIRGEELEKAVEKLLEEMDKKAS